MLIQDLGFFNEITIAEIPKFSGGVNVQTSNTIRRGRLTLNVNLRDVLLDGKNFNSKYTNCSADFDDFTGDLEIVCTDLPGVAEDPNKSLATAN